MQHDDPNPGPETDLPPLTTAGAVQATDAQPQGRRARRRLVLVTVPIAVVALGAGAVAAQGRSGRGGRGPDVDVDALAARLVTGARTLDGTGNNVADPDLGSAGLAYARTAPTNYADGIGAPVVSAVPERALSNRVFNDAHQNLFSANGVTHWGFVWGQFIDHTIGLRETASRDEGEPLAIAFDADDPLEEFTNDLGPIATTRSVAADGTGTSVDAPREQVNVVSSYLDAWNVYGGSADRLDWLREGPVDGDPTNNDALLVAVDGHLPTAADRAGDDPAPAMDLMGHLFADPSAAVVAGDVRANENLGLTAVQTLFLREHNRIVAALPDDLDEETKFQVARRVVGALQQRITYEEFLPAMGVDLPAYAGYDPTVDPTVSNEFATVGYRAHSQVHGEFEAELFAEEVDDVTLQQLAARGVEVDVAGDDAEVAIPLNLAFGNPSLLVDVGLGNVLAGLSSEAAYRNDEQIDNQLRSILFQVPDPTAADPTACLDGSDLASCFTGVNDLGALDVLRGLDHGMPSYNDLREAYGLPRLTSFTDVTGEDTAAFPDDPELEATNPVDDPDALDVLALFDVDGNPIPLDAAEADTAATRAVRRTTTAARLAALFDAVDDLDAFTGMVAEGHVEGTEFGPLQLAMWEVQFTALRDGDRYFHAGDEDLAAIAATWGIDVDRTLAEVIADNTPVTTADLAPNVFFLADLQSAADDAATDASADGDPKAAGDVGDGAGSGGEDGDAAGGDRDDEGDGEGRGRPARGVPPADRADRPERSERRGRPGRG